MTTPTREQVEQWLKQMAGKTVSSGDKYGVIFGESGLEAMLTLARADLEATTAEQAAEIALLRADKHNLYRSWSELRQQLVESQAREQVLRDALENHDGNYKLSKECAKKVDAALSQPTDNTALREWGAKLVEKIRNENFKTISVVYHLLTDEADKIRKGEF